METIKTTENKSLKQYFCAKHPSNKLFLIKNQPYQNELFCDDCHKKDIDLQQKLYLIDKISNPQFPEILEQDSQESMKNIELLEEKLMEQVSEIINRVRESFENSLQKIQEKLAVKIQRHIKEMQKQTTKAYSKLHGLLATEQTIGDLDINKLCKLYSKILGPKENELIIRDPPYSLIDKEINNSLIYLQDITEVGYIEPPIPSDIKPEKIKFSRQIDIKDAIGVQTYHVSEENNYLALGCKNGSVEVYELTTMKRKHRLTVQKRELSCLQFSMNKQLMFTTGFDNTIVVSKINIRQNSLQILKRIPRRADYLTGLLVLEHRAEIGRASCRERV